MTKITQNDVVHLAALSSLKLSPDEITHLENDLGKIFEYIAKLDELDTNGVEPTYQVTDLKNVWRDDSVESGVSSAQLLALSSESLDNQIKVPKVL